VQIEREGEAGVKEREKEGGGGKGGMEREK